MALGYPSRRALLDDERLSGLDLAEWEAFERVEGPIGPGRLDELLRWAVAVILRVMARSGEDLTNLQPPWWRKTDEEAELITDNEEESEAARALISANLGMKQRE